MKQLAYLNKYLFRYKYRLLAGVLFIIGANIFRTLSPTYFRKAIDLVTTNLSQAHESINDVSGLNINEQLLQGIMLFMLTVLGLALVEGLFTFFMRQTIIVMSRKIEFDLRNDIYTHYQNLDPNFYKMHDTGDMMARITEDVSFVREYLGPGIMYMINLSFLVSFVIFRMLQVNSTLTFYVLLPLPFLSISIYIVNNIINQKSERIQQQISSLTTFVQEVYSGIRVVKSYVIEDKLAADFEIETEEYKKRSLQLSRVNSFFFPLMIVLIGLSTIFTIYIGGIQAEQGHITTGNIVEFVMYVNMLTWPVTAIGWVASIIQRAAASQKRINEFLEIAPKIVSGRDEVDLAQANIQFKDVTFTYENTGIKALKNLSFEIKAGEVWAIVGKTGSGKSTLADVLLRAFDVDSGEIVVGDKKLKDLSFHNYRTQIGYVPQEVFLFSESIAENINLVANELNRERVSQAAKSACIYDEIMEFPEGMDTLVGERGVTLSGGQKQRISIARALIKKPDLLIFDDCLSAVDAHTEQKILQNLRNFIGNRTTIIITHRIYSLINYDCILVMDEGKIIEQGTHDTLMQLNAAYTEMYNKQAKLEEVDG